MKPFLLHAALSCLLLTPCFGQDTPAEERPPLPEYRAFGEAASAEDAAALREVMQQFGEAWGRGDAEAVAAHYADDAEWTNAFGDVVRGADSLQVFLTELFSQDSDTTATGETMNYRPLSMRYLGDDVAIVHGVTTSTRGEARGGEGERRVHITYVYAREEGAWQIVHQMIMDARE